jgi:hypothetical protein
MESIATATDRAIEAATHLTVMDQGAVETLRFLAKKIDTEETLRDMALEWAAEDEKRRPPSVDNVSIPTYLKFCESLGLTPAGRVRLDGEKKGNAGGKLASLSPIKRPKRTA